jgi:hypothetical protein
MEVSMDSPAATACARGPTDAAQWRRGGALLFVVALASWWELGYRQGSGLGVEPHVNLMLAAGLMVVAHLGANAIEASTYVLGWRACGVRLPWSPFFVGLVALSLVDGVAANLAGLAEGSPWLAPWLATLAGPQLVREGLPGVGTGLWAAFGGLGLLTLARITATAWLQAAGTGRRLRTAFAVTALTWLATRVAVWWTVDLVRGRSPLP